MLTKSCSKGASTNVSEYCDHNISSINTKQDNILTCKNTQLTSELQKGAQKFLCEKCDYSTSKKSSYDRHILTAKHMKLTIVNNNCEKGALNFDCNICNKQFKSRVGLWKHKKKCIIEDDEPKDPESNINSTNLIIKLLDQNNQLQQQIIQLCKDGINNNTNSLNTTNSHNKSFNLQFFLNETCKNAMNITEFANSIKLSLTDLEKVGELGYVDGISKIIIDNLKLLDVSERPVHCSDFKRESLYVKNNENRWEKENETNSNIKKLINSVTNKNISLIPEWKKKYPECYNIHSRKSTQVNKMIMQVMDTDPNSCEKIIKKISKEVVIEKEH
jgi:hypothetical protein